MKVKTINRFIGYGILIFLIGFFLGLYWIKYLQIAILIGSGLTFVGIFFFFNSLKLTDQFRKDPSDDFLTYFWNVIVLRFWTFIIAIWMILMSVILITHGFLGH